MKIMQKDLIISRITVDEIKGKYEYHLTALGEPVKKVSTDKDYDFGLVNINPVDGSFYMDLYCNQEGVPQTDMEDPNSFVVPITVK